MKDITVDSLGVKFRVTGVPETADEYDALAKKPGSCVESANSNTLYRSVYPDLRAPFLEKVSEVTGKARLTKTLTNKDGSTREEWDESEKTYYNRVLAELAKERGVEVKPTEFQSIADGITVVFDPSVAERTPAGPKSLPKRYKDCVAAWKAAGQLDAAAAKMAKLLGHPVSTDETELGWAVKEHEDAKAKNLSNDLLAA